MDLGKHSMEDLFLSAIKAEVDSQEAYSIMAGVTNNAFLKDRLRFLADEEEKHRLTLEGLFMMRFNGREPRLPEFSPVPLPEIKAEKGMQISELLQQAMDAELAARDFYRSFAAFAKKDAELSETLAYFSRMEEGHYEFLKREKASAEDFEMFDSFNPMMHNGP